MGHIGRRCAAPHPATHSRCATITSTDHTLPAAPIGTTVTIGTVATGDKLKVSELKEGMLLRFKEPRIYKFLRDSGDDHWLDCGVWDSRMTLKWVQTGQPLMIYMGQEKMNAPSHYGGFWNVRKVSVGGRVAWMFPDAWRYVEAL